MDAAYMIVGIATVWFVVAAVSAGFLYIAAEYAFAIIRLCRVLSVNIKERVDPFPRIGSRIGKVRAFLKNAWWLMTDRIVPVFDDGRKIPRYPWQRVIDPPA